MSEQPSQAKTPSRRRPWAGQAISLAANAAVPAGLYALLHSFHVSDLVAIGVGAAMPIAWTIGLALWRRRVNWIGLFSIFGLAVAYAVTVVSGGNPLLLKVHGMILEGPVGVALLASALVGRPLLVPLLQILAPDNPRVAALRELLETPGAPQDHPDHGGHRRRATGSGRRGGHARRDSADGATFLVASKVISWSVVGLIVLAVWWLRRRAARNAL